MIKTKDLVRLMRYNEENAIEYDDHYSYSEFREHYKEITARLRAFDKLKEDIKKMVENLGEKR